MPVPSVIMQHGPLPAPAGPEVHFRETRRVRVVDDPWRSGRFPRDHVTGLEPSQSSSMFAAVRMMPSIVTAGTRRRWARLPAVDRH